jgi:hypothetical protein
MIETLNYGKLRTGEKIEFFNLLDTTLVRNEVKKLDIETVTTDLKQETTKMEGVFQLEKGSPFSIDLENYDAKRDDDIVGMRTISNNYRLHHYDPIIVKAATLVYDIFVKYGKNIEKLNYVSETQVVKRMVDEVNADATTKAAFATLHFTDWFTTLATDNTAFEAKYSTRIYSEATKPTERFPFLKASCKVKYDAIIKRLNAFIVLDKTGVYTQVEKELNALIKQFNLIGDSHVGIKTPPVTPTVPPTTTI